MILDFWQAVKESFQWSSLSRPAKSLPQFPARPAEARAGHINYEKSKILVNSAKARSPTNIKMNGQMLEEMKQFKDLGSTQIIDGKLVRKVRVVNEYLNNESNLNNKYCAIHSWSPKKLFRQSLAPLPPLLSVDVCGL